MVLVLLAAAGSADAAEPAALAQARTLYNAGKYDAAIDAATAARRDPKTEDAATLVLARSHLERFRVAAAPDDLVAARTALAAVRSHALSARDQLDLLIGLGQTLFFGDTFGPAADVFDTALGRAAMLSPRERSRLLDWWATALDREAQQRAPERRPPVFARIVDRMQQELGNEPGSAAANYWLVVGARGAGDLDRAWDAAIAGWVRATLDSETAASLRGELDRVVSEVVIPERARARGGREQADVAAALKTVWDSVKETWR